MGCFLFVSHEEDRFLIRSSQHIDTVAKILSLARDSF